MQAETDHAVLCVENPGRAIDLLASLLEMGEVGHRKAPGARRNMKGGECLAGDGLFRSAGVMHVAPFDKIRTAHVMREVTASLIYGVTCTSNSINSSSKCFCAVAATKIEIGGVYCTYSYFNSLLSILRYVAATVGSCICGNCHVLSIGCHWNPLESPGIPWNFGRHCLLAAGEIGRETLWTCDELE